MSTPEAWQELAARVAAQAAEIERLNTVAAYLKQQEARHHSRAEAAEAERDALRAQLAEAVAKEREAMALLRDLHAMVWGECPSLLDEDSGGSAHLDLAIAAALRARGEPPA